MADTSIEWTRGDDGAEGKTWNPVRGCSIVSPGCHNCYAMRQAHRFSGEGGKYEGLTKLTVNGPHWTGKVRLVPEMLDAPLRWRKPRRIFVNSMSDLFHEELSNEQIAAVFGVMAACPQHTFQILTKRAKRMREWFSWIDERGAELAAVVGEKPPTTGPQAASCVLYLPTIKRVTEAVRAKACHAPWPLPNVWLGVSVEDQRHADERIPELLATPAALRWVSAEPLLGPVDLVPWLHCERCGYTTFDQRDLGDHSICDSSPLRLLEWVVVGGESGPGARPFDIAWARNIVAQCHAARVPVFVKQLGAYPYSGEHGAGWAYDMIGNEQRHWRWDDRVNGDLYVYAQRDRKGGDASEWPEDIRVRAFP